MAQDFAKRHNNSTESSNELSRLSWFLIGFVFGVFAAFLVYLWKVVPPDAASDIGKPTADIISDTTVDKSALDASSSFDFYEMFPKSVVPVVEEYSAKGERIAVNDKSTYALQAGSFRKAADADQLRAELILLGMAVFIQEVNRDNIQWHRVMVGPLQSKLEHDRTRAKLAEENIETISIRIGQ
jgi:cell division protein FtsN